MSASIHSTKFDARYFTGTLTGGTDHIHDGDTLKLTASGDFPIRLLAIDTPEVSFQLNKKFVPLTDKSWEKYLKNVLSDWKDAKKKLGEELFSDLKKRLAQKNVAANHELHAHNARKFIQALAKAEEAERISKSKKYSLFIALCNDVIDTYGRMLGYAFTALEKGEPHRRSYNLQMLEAGLALPYFIWPNIDPFRKVKPFDAAYSPEKLYALMEKSKLMKELRSAVTKIRKAKKGIYNPKTGLILQAFELRSLARKSAPQRPFIDLKKHDEKIHSSTSYLKTAPEDRLFIPEEFVPLFKQNGWK